MRAPPAGALRVMLGASTLSIPLAPVRALAHDGRPLAPHDLPGAWTLDPWMIVPVVAAALLYGIGLRTLWQRSARGRGIRRAEAAAFVAGWVALAVALLSPLHAVGEVLFSAHMIQHELMMVVAAPLLVLGRPMLAMVFAFPGDARQRLGALGRAAPVRAAWRACSAPAAAWLLHAAALWGWHAPGPYQASLRSDAAHALQHASFLGTALLFWWALLRGREARRGQGWALAYVFTTLLHTGLLGALLTFSPALWYPDYAATTAPWGLMPLEDQRLGGLIMWIPGGLSYLVAGLALLASWLRESEGRRRETTDGSMEGAPSLATTGEP